MKAPESLKPLLDYGIIQEVVRPLMSGKEAQVYVVIAGGEECVAKVYKEATQRTFKHRSDYTEGRRTRNTRDQRAMKKRSQHGRKKDEDAWRSTEVDMIYRLRDVGVRVPEPMNFVEGVLVMELVKDAEGNAAPRLGDLSYSPSEALDIFDQLIREVVRMLCAGVIHGDLSEFNVLMSGDGPVVIDFPQSIDPTQNANGEKLFLRDVENLNRFLARFAPEQATKPYGKEIWSLFQKNKLQPDTKLSGRYAEPKGKADTREVMALIEDASKEAELRRGERDFEDEDEFDSPARSVVKAPTPFRTVVDFSKDAKAKKSLGKKSPAKKRAANGRAGRPERRRRGESKQDGSPALSTKNEAAKSEEAPKSRRPRRSRSSRRRKPAGAAAKEGSQSNPTQSPRSAQAGKADADSAKPASPVRSRRRRGGRDRSRPAEKEEPKAGDRPSGQRRVRRRRSRKASPTE